MRDLNFGARRSGDCLNEFGLMLLGGIRGRRIDIIIRCYVSVLIWYKLRKTGLKFMHVYHHLKISDSLAVM